MAKTAKTISGPSVKVQLFTPDKEAVFIRRPNRFLIIARAGDEDIPCHCPNPGRLIEFVFPGAKLILEKRKAPAPGDAAYGTTQAKTARTKTAKAKTAYTAVGIHYRGAVAPLFSSRANRAAELLILKEIIPNLTEIRSEYTIGGSRFDFFCRDKKGKRHLVEVKACSLIEYGAAMFPDAPSGRALKHLEELAALAKEGYECHVLFVIVHGKPKVFIPNLHTDPEFAAALGVYGRAAELPPAEHPAKLPAKTTAGKGPVTIHAALLRCGADGYASLAAPSIPVDLSHGELAASNGGNYLMALELPEKQRIETGALGAIDYAAGWYVYAGSARKNLSQRINRHLRKIRKQKHWHLDYLTPRAGIIKALPVMSYRNLECELAAELGKLGGEPIPGFGSSDCRANGHPRCESHLYYFKMPPMQNRGFVDMLLWYRHTAGLKRD